MSIIGVTVDYGPFGFMDCYDPGHICNASGKLAVCVQHMYGKGSSIDVLVLSD